MIDFTNRTRQLTNAEFRDLPRYSNGDIIEGVFADAWIWATEEQRDQMTGDDQSRGDDLEEELRYMRYMEEQHYDCVLKWLDKVAIEVDTFLYS